MDSAEALAVVVNQLIAPLEIQMSALTDAVTRIDAAVQVAVSQLEPLRQQVADLTAANAAFQAEADTAATTLNADAAQLEAVNPAP